MKRLEYAEGDFKKINIRDSVAGKAYNYNTVKFLAEEIEKREDSISVWQIVWWLITKSPRIIRIIYYLIQLSEEHKMNNDTKTTIIGIIKAVIMVVALFGVQISPEMTNTILSVATGIYAIATAIGGYFTNKKTPTPP